MVDPGTVHFGPAAARPFAVRESDVNGDGRVDAVYYFKVNLTGIACGDTSARLVGVVDGGRRSRGLFDPNGGLSERH